MSLESDRRSIGQQLTASRAAISASMQASRASTFKRDLNSLESDSRKVVSLSTVEAKGSRPATRGVSVYVPPASTGGGGGGIASPLTEQTTVDDGNTVPARAYYAEESLISSDGLFTYVIKPIKTLNFKDTNDDDAVFNLAAPSVPVP